jgi:hypothetical protein
MAIVGRAEKGSRLQVQIYVNHRTQELDEAIRAELPAIGELEWRVPLAQDDYAEPRDAKFLKAIGRADLRESLKEFWPNGGPVWDGLAATPTGGVVLVEGKSHPGEFRSAMKAKDPDSVAKIRAALALTIERLQLDADPMTWATRYYQSANRLAHLYWLRAQNVDAWLVNLLFCNDVTQGQLSTSRTEWDAALPAIAAEIGDPKTEFAAYVFLPAHSAGELEA